MLVIAAESPSSGVAQQRLGAVGGDETFDDFLDVARLRQVPFLQDVEQLSFVGTAPGRCGVNFPKPPRINSLDTFGLAATTSGFR